MERAHTRAGVKCEEEETVERSCYMLTITLHLPSTISCFSGDILELAIKEEIEPGKVGVERR